MELKLYEHRPETLVRIRLTGKGCKPEYLTVSGKNATDTGVELLDELKGVDHHISLDYTTVQLRNAVGGANKQSISFRVYGITPYR
jgi:hypothetical protein